LAGIFIHCNVLAASFLTLLVVNVVIVGAFQEEEEEEEISTRSDRDVAKVEGKDPAIPGSRGNMFV